MARHIACQSASTTGGPSSVSHFVVWTRVSSMLSSALRSVSSSAPSRTTASEQSSVNFGLFDLTRFLRFLWFANPDGFVVVRHDELSQLLHHFESASFLEAFHQNFHRTVTISFLIRQELERVDQVVTDSVPCGEARARKTCASWRSVLSCMTNILFGFLQLHWRHAPPTALLLPVP